MSADLSVEAVSLEMEREVYESLVFPSVDPPITKSEKWRNFGLCFAATVAAVFLCALGGKLIVETGSDELWTDPNLSMEKLESGGGRSLGFQCPSGSSAPVMASNLDGAFSLSCQRDPCLFQSKQKCQRRAECNGNEALVSIDPNREDSNLCCEIAGRKVSGLIRSLILGPGQIALFQPYSSAKHNFGDLIHSISLSPNDSSVLILRIKHFRCPKNFRRVRRSSSKTVPEKVVDDECEGLWGPKVSATPHDTVDASRVSSENEIQSLAEELEGTQTKGTMSNGKSHLCGTKVATVKFLDRF